MILVLVLSVAGPAFRSPGSRDTTPPGDDAALMAGPAVRPLDVVTSSVSRGLASRRSPRVGLDTDEVEHLFDVDDMARRILGPHWKALAPRERGEFVGLFRAMLTQSFVTIVRQHTGDDVASLDEEVAGSYARVRSRITPAQGPEITIEYRLSRNGSRWTVYDVVLDGASLVSAYRRRFNSIIATSSVARLLELMRTEPSRRLQSPDAVAGATVAEPEASARGRLAAGLLLGAASQPRRGR